ncbi:MAG: tyrosine--tRNA ligase [Candidatus Levybacteria bacterium]|nr:tyrosine--tRNA ligase [Candidatus Levybacteria bacterium]
MDKINELLTRGVEKIYPSKAELEKVLRSGKKLKLYYGIDPTGELHIGHMVVLKKVRQFQDLGHEIIILIGDFTATIGDPTDKKTTRQPLTREQVLLNAKDYKIHIGKILDLKKANVRFLHNEEWTNKLKPVDLLKIASQFTVAKLLERDMFQNRIREGKEIYLHEFLYPIFQAYDSVTMDVDLEIGGNDQTFNMLTGRDLIYRMKKKNKFVMAIPLLTDAQGIKIGKTEGNAIILADKPEDLFAKIMALPDYVMVRAFEYLTDVSMDEIKRINESLSSGENPIIYKKRLAFEIVKQLNNEKNALVAKENFEKTVQNKEVPENIPNIEFEGQKLINIIDFLSKKGLTESKSIAKQLLRQNGISINDITIHEPEINIKNNDIIRIGRRRWKIKLKVK